MPMPCWCCCDPYPATPASHNGESVVLFDDAQVGEVPSCSLIEKLTDRYPDEVRFLYGWIPWKLN